RAVGGGLAAPPRTDPQDGHRAGVPPVGSAFEPADRPLRAPATGDPRPGPLVAHVVRAGARRVPRRLGDPSRGAGVRLTPLPLAGRRVRAPRGGGVGAEPRPADRVAPRAVVRAEGRAGRTLAPRSVPVQISGIPGPRRPGRLRPPGVD